VAATATVALVATGLLQTGLHVPAVGALRSSVYGWSVVAKLALVAGALALAAVNTLLVHPRLAAQVGRRLGRAPGWRPRAAGVVLAEVVVLALGVGVAGLMTSVPTALEASAADLATAPHHEELAGLYLTFEALSAGPDEVTLVVRARATVVPATAPVRSVRVTVDGPGGTQPAVTLDRLGAGSWQARVPRPSPGRWTARVAVTRQDVPDVVMSAPWVVADPDDPPWTRLRTATALLALLLLGGLGGVLLAVRAGRGHRVRPEAAHLPEPQPVARELVRSPR
jgi:hypothetical protein